jgi:hypothetical protein
LHIKQIDLVFKSQRICRSLDKASSANLLIDAHALEFMSGLTLSI